jgi:hypothetical protein
MEVGSRRWMMAPITLEAVIELADQLPLVEQHMLISHLQEQAQAQELTSDEWIALFDASVIQREVIADFSPRREDWYDDDGR